jgi:hypothetical protein
MSVSHRGIVYCTATIGLDIAKNVFQVHGIDAAEKVVVRKQLRRGQVLKFFEALPPCLVGMEACASAHYWARELTKLGHKVRLMPAKDVIQMIRSPRLAAHPILKIKRVYADFETTRDRGLYQDEYSQTAWPVYAGESFDVWMPDTKRYYAWTKEGVILPRALERRLRSPTYSIMPRAWLQDDSTHPALHPRIAYRDVTNRTNTRTLIAALIPPKAVTTSIGAMDFVARSQSSNWS